MTEEKKHWADGNPIMEALEEGFAEMKAKEGHPRRKDAAQKSAVVNDGKLTAVPKDSPADKKLKDEAAYDGLLDVVERDPWAPGSGGEAQQAKAITEFLDDFKIVDDSMGEWAVGKIAEAENNLIDLTLSYEHVKREWEGRIKAYKHRLEVREGLFKESLRVFAEGKVAGKKKKSFVCGQRLLGFRSEKLRVVIGDRSEIIKAILKEDPLLEEGRLVPTYEIADLDAEKKRAITRLESTGEPTAGFEIKPGQQLFMILKPKEEA